MKISAQIKAPQCDLIAVFGDSQLFVLWVESLVSSHLLKTILVLVAAPWGPRVCVTQSVESSANHDYETPVYIHNEKRISNET